MPRALSSVQKARHAGDASLNLRQRHDQAHWHNGFARGVLDVRLCQGVDEFVDIDEALNLLLRKHQHDSFR